MSDAPASASPGPVGKCPICGKPRDQRFRPFCSRQCRDRDFLAWADGRYAIPATPDPDEEELEAASRAQDVDRDD